MIQNVVEVDLDPRTGPLLRQLLTRKGYSFFSNGHWYALKLSDERCVQFDFTGDTVEMSPAVFEAVRGVIYDF